MSIILYIFTLLLIVFAVWDIKKRAIPSVLLTATLILLIFIRFWNLEFAITLALFGLMMWEFSDKFGIGDIKVMAMLGFFCSTYASIIIFMICYVIAQVGWIYIFTKAKKLKEIPLIPLFLILWVCALIVGGVFA